MLSSGLHFPPPPYPACMERGVFRDTFLYLQERIQAARVKHIAVVRDAAAIIELVGRARAARHGELYQPEAKPTFVPASRSRFSH
jgi:hypothetical protein